MIRNNDTETTSAQLENMKNEELRKIDVEKLYDKMSKMKGQKQRTLMQIFASEQAVQHSSNQQKQPQQPSKLNFSEGRCR